MVTGRTASLVLPLALICNPPEFLISDGNQRSDGEQTDILDISIVSYDSRRAAALVNLIMDSYIDVHLSSSKNEARSVREFISAQVSEYEKRLAESENAVENFKKEYWEPELFIHSNLGQWKEMGSKSVWEYANEIVKKRIEEHTYRVDKDVRKELDKIYERAKKDTQLEDSFKFR